MAGHMRRLVADPEYAGELGAAARMHIATSFTMQRSLGGLWEILQSAIDGAVPPPPPVSPSEVMRKR